tara:strand:+ start:5669 stop:8929 length:3261 start_codon:yes stop_codon:yes gene_type:complete
VYQYLAYDDPFTRVSQQTDLENGLIYGSTSIDSLPTVDMEDGDSRILQCEMDRIGGYRYVWNGGYYDYMSNRDVDIPFSDSSSNDHSVSSYHYNILLTGNYLNYLSFAIESRMDVVRRAVRDVMDETPGINIGIMPFDADGDGAYIGHPIEPVSIAKDTISARLNMYSAESLTPVSEALYEAHLYFAGKEADAGDDARGTVVWEARPNPVGMFTGDNEGEYDAEPDERVWEDPDADDLVYSPPSSLTCTPSKILFFSDGEPTGDTSADSEIDDLIRDLAAYQQIPDVDYLDTTNCSQCGEEIAYYLAHADQRSDLAGIQTVSVDTMGGFFDRRESDEEEAIEFLTDMAEAGNGTFYTANNYEEMKDGLSDSFTNVNTDPSTFISPTVAVSSYNSLRVTEEIYYTVFQPAESTAWRGNLKRYKLGSEGQILADIGQDFDPENGESAYYLEGDAIDEDSGYFKLEARSYWSDEADGYYVDQGGMAHRFTLERNIFTDNGSALVSISDEISVPGSGLVGSLFSHLSSLLTDTLLSKDLLGISGASDEEQEDLINWIGGLSTGTDDDDNEIFIAREEMEDPLHSQPLIINYGPGDRVLFMGTNSGYLHAFRVELDNAGEVFSYIPRPLLTSPVYYQDPSSDLDDKAYGMDGRLSFWHKDLDYNNEVDGSDKVYLYAGMRRGGSSYYALDVTDPENPSIAWQIHGPYQDTNKNVPSVTTGFSALGQTWSRMVPAQIRWDGASRVVLFFTGGYDTDKDDQSVRTADDLGATLYMVDAETGALLWNASINATLSHSMQYSFTTDPIVLDRDNDGASDLLYAADTGGQVWRFDLSETATSADEFASGGVIADIAGSSASNDRRFFNNPDLSYISYTYAQRQANQDIVSDDFDRYGYVLISIGSGNRASPLEEATTNYHFLIKDTLGVNSPLSGYTTTDFSDLTEWGNGDSDYGWYVPLSLSGEKVLSSSVTFRGQVFFTTYSPSNDENSDACGGDAGNGGKYTLDIYTPTEDAVRASLGQNFIPGEPVITALPESVSSDDDDDDETPGEGEEGEEENDEDNDQCSNYGVIVSTSVELSDDICTNLEKEYWKENN